MEKLTFYIPTKSFGYDWTFRIGKYIYDRYDVAVIEQQEQKQSDRNPIDPNENDSIIEYDMDNDDYKKQLESQPKSKQSKINTSWLLVINDREFINNITITPGIKITIN